MITTVEVSYKPGPDNPVLIHTPEEMDAFLDKLLTEPFEHSVATMYHLGRPFNEAGVPDHQLMVAVDSEDGVGGLAYMGYCRGEGGNWYTKGAVSKYDEVVYYFQGNERDFPRDSEIPLDLIRQATKEFLANGGECPTCVEWQLKAGPDMD